MNKAELIKLIKIEKYEIVPIDGIMEFSHNEAIYAIADIINEALEGYSIVPTQLIIDIYNLKECEYDADEQIYELCRLAPCTESEL
jgi:hypothetical protein